NDISADEVTMASNNGWTAVLEKDGEYYKDITFIHEDGRIVRHNSNYLSIIPYNLTYSPDGTRVVAEYQHSESYTYRFMIVSLNEDDIDVDYMDQYFGEYIPGSVKWLDNDNIEGTNQFGRFTINVFDFFPVQFADAPYMTDPNNTNVKEVSHRTIGHTLTLNVPEIWSYGQKWLNEFYHDGVRIANHKTDTRAHLYVEDKYYSYKLEGKTEEDWLTNPNGIQYLIVTDEYSDPVKVYNILFRCADTVVCDFAVNQYQSDPEEYFDTVVQPLIDSAVVVPDASASGKHSPSDSMLYMSVSELEKKYGKLTLEYSEHGPGQPVYSVEYMDGVYLVFHNWNMDDPLEDDMIPDELIVTNKMEYTINGITIGKDISEFVNILDSYNHEAFYSMMNGMVLVKFYRNNVCSVECSVSAENLNLPDEVTATTADWEEWAEKYLHNPTGIIRQIRVSLIP
ncbi:MAG: hypothetical protein J6S76_05385, partial [Clostridia bacterium]|nr:hypothetical protein [Clostridia bacterium]